LRGRGTIVALRPRDRPPSGDTRRDDESDCAARYEHGINKFLPCSRACLQPLVNPKSVRYWCATLAKFSHSSCYTFESGRGKGMGSCCNSCLSVSLFLCTRFSNLSAIARTLDRLPASIHVWDATSSASR
jgi:hypothetical protein